MLWTSSGLPLHAVTVATGAVVDCASRVQTQREAAIEATSNPR